jgi:hypothetical protein
MTKRDPHPDNALIDELQADGPAPTQGGSAGGQINRDVGSRSEMHNTAGETGVERPHAHDHPKSMNEAKGDKTRARLAPDGED